MKQEKAGAKTIILYVLGVIFAATFVYGVVYSVMQVTSTVAQYTAMGQDIPASYTVNAIVSGIIQLALPSLFFCAASFALGYLLKGKDVKEDDTEEVIKVEVEEKTEDAPTDATAEEKAEDQNADDAEEVTTDDAPEAADDTSSEDKAEAEKDNASEADAQKEEAEKETAEDTGKDAE